MEVVKDDGATWSLVRDATGTSLVLAAAVATGAFVLTVLLVDSAPLFAFMQLVALLGLAVQLLDEREVVTVSRPERVVRVERSVLGWRRRVVPVAFADIDAVGMESHQSGLMRRPRYRVVLRLQDGIAVPLLSSFALARPDATARQLRTVLGLPHDDDDNDDDVKDEVEGPEKDEDTDKEADEAKDDRALKDTARTTAPLAAQGRRRGRSAAAGPS